MRYTRKKKHIAYVSVVHDLHDHRFLYKQCGGLEKHGFDIDYFVRSEKKQTVNGVSIKPIGTKKSRIKRFLGTFLLFKALAGKRYDAIHLVDPELIPLGLLLKLTTAKAVIFDAHEDYTTFIKHKYYLPKSMRGFLSAMLTLILKIAGKMMDAYVFADEGTANAYQGMPPSKKLIFRNFPLLSMFPENPISWKKRQFDISYLGTMSDTSGIFIMLDAISSAEKQMPGLKCVLIGEPDNYYNTLITEYIAKNGLKEIVSITGRLPHKKVPDVLRDCRVGLIGLKNMPKFNKNIATKMFEYMASGVPVVSSDLPPERQYMQNGTHCFFVPPENPDMMASAIVRILSTPGLGVKMAMSCREHMVKNGYFAEYEIDRLSLFYHSLLRSKAGIHAEAYR